MASSAWCFTVPLPVAPLTPNSRTHWGERARCTRLIRGQVALLAASERTRGGVPKATGRRAVELVLLRGKGERLLDPDNLVAACKPVIDALRDSRWLLDDRASLLDLRVDQRRDASGPAVVVTVGEVVP